MTRTRWFLLGVALSTSAAFAQGLTFEGLNKRKPKPTPSRARVQRPQAPTPTPNKALSAKGLARVVAIPPLNAKGNVDRLLYIELHKALEAQLGPRLVSIQETLRAVDALGKVRTLGTEQVRERLATTLNTPLSVTFESDGNQVNGILRSAPGAVPSVTTPQRRVRRGAITAAHARDIASLLVVNGQAVLTRQEPEKPTPVEAAPKPPPTEVVGGFDLSSDTAKPAPPPPQPTPRVLEPGLDEVPEEFRLPTKGNVPTVVKKPKKIWSPTPPTFQLFAGAGLVYRGMDIGKAIAPLVPPALAQVPKFAAGFAFNVRFMPLRLAKSISGTAYDDLYLDGYYRLTLVEARVDKRTLSVKCGASDWEAAGRIGYRIQIPVANTRLGLAFGVGHETTTFADGCNVNVLPTVNTSTEYMLSVLQPLGSEKWTLELIGGPKLLFSTRALGFDTYSFLIEAWLTWRPMEVLTLRLGGRVTNTKQVSWPNGFPTVDTRAFVGLQIGASI